MSYLPEAGSGEADGVAATSGEAESCSRWETLGEMSRFFGVARLSHLHGAVHLGVKWALAMVASHYEIDLERVCNDYVLPDEPELATTEAQRLNDAVEGLGTLLAHHFKVEVVPPPPLPAGAEPPAGPPPTA
jgi:hypothetical protein